MSLVTDPDTDILVNEYLAAKAQRGGKKKGKKAGAVSSATHLEDDDE